jgi:HK97 family phage portal protein
MINQYMKRAGFDISAMSKKDKKARKHVSRSIRGEGLRAQVFDGVDDPAFKEFIRNSLSGGGARIGENKALMNSALNRCVNVISECIAYLPIRLLTDTDEKEVLKDDPLHRLIKRKPNDWQTAYEFKRQMQVHLLEYGNAYARVIRSGRRVVSLVPMHPTQVAVEQLDDWSLRYTYTGTNGKQTQMGADEVFHLRDYSEDGIKGVSRVKLAREALGIAFSAEKATRRTFAHGVMASGAVEVPKALTDEGFSRLRESLSAANGGVENAGGVILLEDGAKAAKWSSTAVDAQLLENRAHQIEEVARFFGVPRPLLMLDDTSWGSGINELGIFFIKFGLNPWLTLWEQALERVLLSDDDGKIFKFNIGALLHGSLKDQAEYFSRALGAGGTQPWMTQNEVRRTCDLPCSKDKDADSLKNPMTLKKMDRKRQTDELD